LCDRFFAESMADGWWISPDSQRQTTIQLSNQAVDMLSWLIVRYRCAMVSSRNTGEKNVKAF
jgi:hypothetical protein